MQCRGRQPHGGVFGAMLLRDDAGGYVLVGVVCCSGGGRYRVLHTIEKKQ